MQVVVFSRKKSTEVMLLDRCMPEPNSGCWLWVGAVDLDGYGVMNATGKRRAHRHSYKTFVCDPGDKMVLHKCDNRLCINPEHLTIGDHKENMRQMRERGRVGQGCGERNSNAKLTNDQAEAIRLDPRSSYAVSLDYGVSDSLIRMIRRGDRRG